MKDHKIELLEEIDVLEVDDMETEDSFFCCVIVGGKEPD